MGKPSHAAGFPWEGVNALDAAVTCYNSIACLRQQLKPEWRVHCKRFSCIVTIIIVIVIILFEISCF